MRSGLSTLVCLVALVACAPSPGSEAVDDPDGATAALEAPWEAPPRTIDTGSHHRRLERLPQVRVSNAEELVRALQSGRRITLAAGRYDLSGLGVVVREVNDLVIEGPAAGAEDANAAVLFSSQCVEPLLSFVECENVELRGLTLARRVLGKGEAEAQICDQPILMARAGYRLTLVDCHLLGAGTAATVTRYNAFYLVGGSVSECRRVLTVRNSKHLGFEGTRFERNSGKSLFAFRGRDTRHISFSGCLVQANNLGADGGIFDLDASLLPVDVIDCFVTGNIAGALAIGPGTARLTLRSGRIQRF